MNSGDEGKIFVGGLHWNTTNEGLKAYFEQFGQVLECNIMRDPTGRSRCFGFVSFADPMAVDVVLQKTHILDKKQIDPKRAIPKDQQSSSTAPPQRYFATHGGGGGGGGGGGSPRDGHKVFVGGIHIEADENDLKEFFGRYDQVLQAVLMRDRDTGRSRGFGFVTLATFEGAQRACADTEASIRRRRVEIKMAVPKGRSNGGGVGSRHSEGLATSPGSSSADPYAAWAEYFKQNPEYYEAMMKAYSDPATMAAYYNQYYGQSGAPGGGDAVPGSYPAKTDASSGGGGGGGGAYEVAFEQSNDPSEYYALDTEGRREEDHHGYAEDSGRGYERGDQRRTFQSRSRSTSPRRGRSRSRSPSRHYHHARERNAPDSYRGHRGFPGSIRGGEDHRDHRRLHDRRERDRRGGPPGERAFEHDHHSRGEERGGHRYADDHPSESATRLPPPRAYQQAYNNEALDDYKEGNREQ